MSRAHHKSEGLYRLKLVIYKKERYKKNQISKNRSSDKRPGTYCIGCLISKMPARSSLIWVHIVCIEANPYPVTIFCPENVVCFLRLLHIFKCTSTRYFHRSKQYKSCSDCSQGRSLIWVHIVCNIGYIRTYY